MIARAMGYRAEPPALPDEAGGTGDCGNSDRSEVMDDCSPARASRELAEDDTPRWPRGYIPICRCGTPFTMDLSTAA